ncbi:hypothetical protein SMJ63A_100131 [Stenotrophomonas geniculata]
MSTPGPSGVEAVKSMMDVVKERNVKKLGGV